MNSLKQIHEILHQQTRGGQAHWLIRRKTGYLLRLTNNYIHQSGYQDQISVSLRLMRGERMGVAETSDVSRAGLGAVIAAAQKATEVAEAGSLKVREGRKENVHFDRVKDYFAAALAFSPQMASRKMLQALECVKQLGALAHGYFSSYEWQTLVGNSSGLNLEHSSTGTKFGLTVNRGIGSGYQTVYHPDARKINFFEIAEEALKHACLTERQVAIKPGRYPVILAPRALAAFLSNFLEEWNGLRFCEKESFLIHHRKKPIGSKLWTVMDDVTHPLQTGAPFDVEGDARKKVALVNKGRFANCVYDRWTAERYRVKTTGHSLSLGGEEGALPYNIVVSGGKSSLGEMIRNIKRGILIPNIWYHQVVNPSHWTVTGLTRGGAAWILDGKIAGGLGRIRYLDGLLGALARTSVMSREQFAVKVRDSGVLVFPYVQIEDLRIV